MFNKAYAAQRLSLLDSQSLQARVDRPGFSPHEQPGSVLHRRTESQPNKNGLVSLPLGFPKVERIISFDDTNHNGIAGLNVCVVKGRLHVRDVPDTSTHCSRNTDYSPTISPAILATDWAYIAVELGSAALLAALVAWVFLLDWQAADAALTSVRQAVCGG